MLSVLRRPRAEKTDHIGRNRGNDNSSRLFRNSSTAFWVPGGMGRAPDGLTLLKFWLSVFSIDSLKCEIPTNSSKAKPMKQTKSP